MSSQFTSLIIFAAIALPVAFAWHSFVTRYLYASLIAALNIMTLLLLLMLCSGQYGHYLGRMLLVGFGLSLLTALLVGLPFRLARRKGAG